MNLHFNRIRITLFLLLLLLGNSLRAAYLLIPMDEAQKNGLSVIFEPVRLDQLITLDEAFLTSASRAILPVSQVESQVIGGGHAGEMTRVLRDLYDRKIQSELEKI